MYDILWKLCSYLSVCLVAVIIVGLQWPIEISCECIWSFLALLIEAVALGQLGKISPRCN